MRIQNADVSFEIGRLRALDDRGWPALVCALMSVTSRPCNDVPTAAVDEWWRCYWNPAWFKTLTAEQASAIAVHEVWHLLRFHFVRARAIGVRKEHLYLCNLVQDAEIHEGNDKLLAVLKTIPNGEPVTRMSFDPPLSEGGVFESWFHELLARPTTKQVSLGGPDGAPGDGSGDSIFVPKMADRPAPDFAGGGGIVVVYGLPPAAGGAGGSGSSGLHAPWEEPGPDQEGGSAGVSRERMDVIRHTVAEDLTRHSRSRGAVEGGMLRWAQEVIEPVVDWRTALQVGFQGVMGPSGGNAFWTYKRPARRTPYDPRIVLPGWAAPRQRVAVMIDTSGSMSDDMLSLCRQEVTSLLGTLARNGQRPYVKVYACDTRPTEAQQVWGGADIKLVGGGGTDLTVGFRKIEDDMRSCQEAYDVVVCVTDGFTPWPLSFPVPVVSVLVSDGATPAWLAQAPHQLIKVNMADVLRKKPVA